MRKSVAILILCLSGVSAYAEDSDRRDSRWAKRFWQASLAAVAAGSVVDMSSSLGKHETNGILANHQGVFSTQGVGLKLAMAGAALGTQHFILKRHSAAPAYKTSAFVNFAIAGVMGAAAAHNYQVNPVK